MIIKTSLICSQHSSLQKTIDSLVTNDARKGLDLIKEKKYDVILLDLSMPEFSGIDVIQNLEREKILQDQKIIIYSAVAVTDRLVNDLMSKEGIKDCLKKPIELEKTLCFHY